MEPRDKIRLDIEAIMQYMEIEPDKREAFTASLKQPSDPSPEFIRARKKPRKLSGRLRLVPGGGREEF